MSNQQVGNIYQQIINDCLEASRVDFEEGGVDDSVLEELKKGWQAKLSQQNLATFPWDPRPEPTPAPAATAPAPQPVPASSPPQPAPNGAAYAAPQQTAAQGLTMPTPSGQLAGEPRVKPEPGVKIEPGLEPTPVMTQARPVHDQGAVHNQHHNVHDRVAAQLQHQYGDRAAASINKLRQVPNPHRPQQPMHVNPGVPQQYATQQQLNAQQPQQLTPQQHYSQTLAANTAMRQPRAHMPNGQRPPSQVDGAAEDEEHLHPILHQGFTGGSTEMNRDDIDRLLHSQIVAKAKAMEGNGLMIPLKRAKKAEPVSSRYQAAPGEGPSQFDGPDDDVKDEDEDDEDAINSDLDDPDDNLEENDEDDDNGQIMLCTYDKVQRVKNKWKCVLKDGVLNVNGRDYVFHKANGEYEW
ncbi:transcription factor IIA, alpha/beta subunit [Xylariaceae sp. FL0804]|nr:transcription factor IIA, alpha/beta subunit [Xylariaceae sp. FL0804]